MADGFTLPEDLKQVLSEILNSLSDKLEQNVSDGTEFVLRQAENISAFLLQFVDLPPDFIDQTVGKISRAFLPLKKLTTSLHLTAKKFDDLLRETFPQLKNKDYEFCRVDRHRTVHVLPSILKTLKDIRMYPDMGRSALYLRPKEDIEDSNSESECSDVMAQVDFEDSDLESESSVMQVVLEESDLDSEHSVTQDASEERHAESDDSVIQQEDKTVSQVEPADSGLQEWRALRSQQDAEYALCLRTDQEKDQRIKQAEENEQKRLKIIEERKNRVTEEPADGIPLKIHFPNDSTKIRRFRPSDLMQVLFDFIGTHKSATEVFIIREMTSALSVMSTTSGTLLEYNLTSPLNIHVQWLYVEDIQTVPETASVASPLHSPVTSPPYSPVTSPPYSPVTSPPYSPVTSPPYSPVTSPSAVEASTHDPVDIDYILDEFEDIVDLKFLLHKMQNKVDFTSTSPSNQINATRSNILGSALRAFQRKRFNPYKKLDVIFRDADGIGEGAADEGGPTREFLTLLMREIQSCEVFEGHDCLKTLSCNSKALYSGMYKQVGRMIAVCLIHGGVEPHFFSEQLFSQVCNIKPPAPHVEDIVDYELREKMKTIQSAQNVADAQKAIMGASEELSLLGSLRHIQTLEDRDDMVEAATNVLLDSRLRDSVEQFKEGLQCLELLKHLQKYPSLFKGVLMFEEKPLTARDLADLFIPQLSPVGTNKRALESRMVCYWRDWLLDVEEGASSPLTLNQILAFASGSTAIPRLGFQVDAMLEFLHQQENKPANIFPEANTCSIVLRLPIHQLYEDFAEYMKNGILQAPSFGVM